MRLASVATYRRHYRSLSHSFINWYWSCCVNSFIRPSYHIHLAILFVRASLEAAQGTSKTKIARQWQVDYETVRRWRDRWHAAESRLQVIEAAGKPKLLSQAIEVLLTDEQRPGAPPIFTLEQFMQIMALACEKPEAVDRPVSSWTPRELADEAVKRGIVTQISPRTVERFLKGERFTAPS